MCRCSRGQGPGIQAHGPLSAFPAHCWTGPEGAWGPLPPPRTVQSTGCTHQEPLCPSPTQEQVWDVCRLPEHPLAGGSAQEEPLMGKNSRATWGLGPCGGGGRLSAPRRGFEGAIQR